jgi:predicted N-acyltransferase
MALTIDVHRSLQSIDDDAYRALHAASAAPVFYDRRFLDAAEHSPLLPVEKVFYLCARDGDELVGVLPAYLQRVAAIDPLGLLQRTAGVRDDGGDLGLFSHIMHCWDSTVPVRPDRGDAFAALLREYERLARGEGARHAGLLNVRDAGVLGQARGQGYRACHLVDRYDVDLRRFDHFEQFVQRLPNDGRCEMNRQLRKFEASGATARVIAPPFDGVLERLTELCFRTTARNGTPQYFPSAPLARFVRRCGGLVRLVVVECEDELVGGIICFEQGDHILLWSAGVVYDRSSFSPYSLCFASAYRYAFARGLKRLEGGRLNERIKRRLGLTPVPLYSLIARDLPLAALESRAGLGATPAADPARRALH